MWVEKCNLSSDLNVDWTPLAADMKDIHCCCDQQRKHNATAPLFIHVPRESAFVLSCLAQMKTRKEIRTIEHVSCRAASEVVSEVLAYR